ncbi:MAG: oligosaccharide flippase family protein, partial [Gracilimonas sp.]
TVEDVTLVPVLYTAGVSMAALTLGTFAIKDKPFTLPTRGFQIFPDLLKTSSILGLGKFFAQIVHLLPPLIIGGILSLHDAGQYGAAFRIVVIAMMIDRVFVNLLLPNLASIWVADRSVAAEKVSTVFKLVVGGGAFIALFIALSSEPIIHFLYGAEYSESIILLQILTVMIAVTFINSLFSFGLIATNKDKEYFLATCFGGTISAILIFSFAAIGNTTLVVISVSLAEIIITLFTYFWFRKVIPINYIAPLLKSYPVAILLFILFSFSPLLPVVNAVIASIIFLGIIHQLEILQLDEFQWAKDKLLK